MVHLFYGGGHLHSYLALEIVTSVLGRTITFWSFDLTAAAAEDPSLVARHLHGGHSTFHFLFTFGGEQTTRTVQGHVKEAAVRPIHEDGGDLHAVPVEKPVEVLESLLEGVQLLVDQFSLSKQSSLQSVIVLIDLNFGVLDEVDVALVEGDVSNGVRIVFKQNHHIIVVDFKFLKEDLKVFE